MKNNKLTLFLLSAVLATACTNHQSKPKKIAEVEYAQPVHVSSNVKSQRVYSPSSSTNQAGVVRPYSEVVSSSGGNVNSSGNVKQAKPYIPDAGSYNTRTVNLNDETYQVKPGDTLYSIAFRYGKDYRELAQKNNIDVPYNISVGQIIHLNSKTTTVAPVANNQKIYIVKNGDTAVSVAKKHGLTLSQLVKANQLKKPYSLEVGQKLNLDTSKSIASAQTNPKLVPVAGSENKTSTSVAQVQSENMAPAAINEAAPVRIVSGKTASVSGVSWMWPAKGTVIRNFSSSNKGIDIAGSRGQNINAAAAGQVVYSGNALRGYGNLVIINHNNEFLSAYAHNDMLLVKEGQNVKRGQVIAKMGSTDASRVMLHFEIRYKGNSVNPRNYLPK
ncbi:MAG: peptidoglycan DD-metalloendopeptidase family protein [Succinivibrio sp.]|uniref:Mandelamide amidase n=1 Tax=uncultured Succinivibrio sp. TaxID=540749 RepID=A0A346HVI2_9GAMM|nr:peptidoglycan DD-metalloendopeptidase family protein [uncultured Succinivibrio sp.]AXP07342.1 mandelamide amidase [uncultured Succinivibrio sp.]MBQ3883375.1 peptidoglycan DD-metalloendopeptidase family protein [Succinivibrio sp.]